MTRPRSSLEGRVVEEIARREPELTALVRALVAFDTRAPEPDLAPRQEAELQAYVARRLRAAGLEVELWEPDPTELPASRYAVPEGHHFRGRSPR